MQKHCDNSIKGDTKFISPGFLIGNLAVVIQRFPGKGTWRVVSARGVGALKVMN